MTNLNPNNYPCLFNLLALSDVIDPKTTVEDLDAGGNLNLCDMIKEARKELGWSN